MQLSIDGAQARSSHRSLVKYVVVFVVAVMTAYVLYHNERFLFDSENPPWERYESFTWWLLPHVVIGACIMILAPMQFSDRLRNRFAKLHRISGRIYVAGVLLLAPIGVYVQIIEETQIGSPRSLTAFAVVQAVLLTTTTGMGLLFAIRRMIVQHRQWMTRSYAVALTFFEARFILGVTGWDRPFDFQILETVLWACLALSVFVGDLTNQWQELHAPRPR